MKLLIVTALVSISTACGYANDPALKANLDASITHCDSAAQKATQAAGIKKSKCMELRNMEDNDTGPDND